MASKKISQLDTITSLTENDVFVVNQLGSTKKVSLSTVTVSSKAVIDNASIAAGSTSYTLKLSDANRVILCNNTAPLTASIPADIFSVGTEMIMIQRGEVVTLSAGVGVTIESNGNKLKTNGTSAGVCLINIANNTWFLGGNTAT